MYSFAIVATKLIELLYMSIFIYSFLGLVGKKKELKEKKYQIELFF